MVGRSVRNFKREAGRAELNLGKTSQQLLDEARANELFIAVVAPAGAGAGTAAAIVKNFIESKKINNTPFEAFHIKASAEIKKWARANKVPVPSDDVRKRLSSVREMQDAGDKMRLNQRDNAAVVRSIISRIRVLRSERSGKPLGEICQRRSDSRPSWRSKSRPLALGSGGYGEGPDRGPRHIRCRD